MGLGLLVASLAVVMGGLWPYAVAADAPVAPVTSEVDAAFATHEIAVRDHSFDPETVTITVGSIVRWTNVGETLHTTTSDDGHWNWTLVPGASYSVRFLSAGTYDYHCTLHRVMGMTGTIVVVPSTEPTATPEPLPTGLPAPGQIVFDYYADEATRSKTDLFVVNPDGSMKRKLTETADLSEAQPNWSPDRRHVAYTATEGGTEPWEWNLWTVDVETGARVQITEGPEHYEPDWHPSGNSIVFTSIGRTGSTPSSSEIAVVAADGTGMRALMRLDSTAYGVVNPTWSPDGLHIAFTLSSNFTGGELYIMNADGSNVRRVLSRTGWNDLDPAWSPDGRHIAFASGEYRGASSIHDIWLVDVSTGIAGTIARHTTWDLRHPAWSPDGRTIVFNAEFEARRWALYLVPSRGGAVSGPVSVGVEPDWAGGSLIPLPTPPPGATETPPFPLTPLPFPTPMPTIPGPTPMPTLPGPTDPPPPPPTFPVPIEPTPESHTPTSVIPTLPPVEPTNPTPDPTRGNKIYLSITYKNG